MHRGGGILFSMLLYHFNEATCGAKVRLTLAEKGAVYEEKVLDRRQLTEPAYLALNPNGVVPTLVDRGEAIIESAVIMNYIEDACPGPQLRPADPLARARMNHSMKLADDIYLGALGAVTYTTLMRDRLAGQTPQQRQAMLDQLPDPAKRERRRRLLERGPDSPDAAYGMKALAGMIQAIENWTASGAPFIAGDRWTLGDAALAPFCYRLDLFGLLGPMLRGRPHAAAWWRTIQDRPSFRTVLIERTSRDYRAMIETAMSPHLDLLLQYADTH